MLCTVNQWIILSYICDPFVGGLLAGKDFLKRGRIIGRKLFECFSLVKNLATGVGIDFGVSQLVVHSLAVPQELLPMRRSCFQTPVWPLLVRCEELGEKIQRYCL